MRRSLIAVAALAAAGLGIWLGLSSRPEPTRSLRGESLGLRLPKSWSGYVRPSERVAGGTRGALVAAANFPLPVPDDDLGSAAMRRMNGSDVRIFVQDLTDPAAPRWYRRQFPRLQGPLEVRSRDFERFEGIPWSHAFARRLLRVNGRELQVSVDFVSPAARRAELGAVNRILATLSVDAAG